MQTLKCTVQEALDSLEVKGLVRKTDDFRRGNDGDLQPVYVQTLVSEWLDKTGLMGEFLTFLDTKKRMVNLKRTPRREVLLKIEKRLDKANAAT